MDAAGLGTWRRQVNLGGGRWCGRVDFKHEFRPLVLEVQSERYHAALIDREHDARRRAALEAAGFTVVEIWDIEIWHHRDIVEDRVAAALRNLQLIRSPGRPNQLQVR
jgi:very-short-patch-repair endonuclease